MVGYLVVKLNCNIGISIKISLLKEENIMLYWAAVFLIIAIIAGLLGFTGIAVAAAGIAKVLFVLFLIIFLVLLVAGISIGRRPPST